MLWPNRVIARGCRSPRRREASVCRAVSDEPRPSRPNVPAVNSRRPPFALAVVGPTGTGKTALALAVARRWAERGQSAEAISVDSMQVYRGMDIGTAKATLDEQRQLLHHLIDIVEPHDEFDVATFVDAAARARASIEARGARPIYVGGTGLYHRAVIDRLDIPGQWPEVAAALAADGDTAALHRRLVDLDPVGASRMEPTNRRRVLRALEVTIGSGRPFSKFGPGLSTMGESDVIQVGLDMSREQLTTRLEQRLSHQIEQGFVDEVTRLWAAPKLPSRTAAQALGYRELLAATRGETSLEDAMATTLTRTRQFAVRQIRWFRRDPRVHWIPADAPLERQVDAVEKILQGAQGQSATLDTIRSGDKEPDR